MAALRISAMIFLLPLIVGRSDALPQFLPGMPGIPSLPDASQLPQVPGVPSVSDASQVPGMPPIPDVAQLPQMPEIPSMSDASQLPQVPGVPPMPDVSQLPQVPGMPLVSDASQTSGMQPLRQLPRRSRLMKMHQESDISQLPEMSETQLDEQKMQKLINYDNVELTGFTGVETPWCDTNGLEIVKLEDARTAVGGMLKLKQALPADSMVSVVSFVKSGMDAGYRGTEMFNGRVCDFLKASELALPESNQLATKCPLEMGDYNILSLSPETLPLPAASPPGSDVLWVLAIKGEDQVYCSVNIATAIK